VRRRAEDEQIKVGTPYADSYAFYKATNTLEKEAQALRVTTIK